LGDWGRRIQVPGQLHSTSLSLSLSLSLSHTHTKGERQWGEREFLCTKNKDGHLGKRTF
jgi:hypothetical protein